MDCLMNAWSENEQFLKNWLLNKTGDSQQADDLLQDVFLKALKNKERFCSLAHARSWLLTMTKNTVIDAHRRHKPETESVDELAQPEIPEIPVVLELRHCMKRVLGELSDKDREAIQLCDIRGVSQKEYASMKGLSLAAGKSRVQRARQKLRSEMVDKCQIQFDHHGLTSFTPRKE